MSLKEILVNNGFRFNKKYGQNFISDGNLLSSIVSLSSVTGNDVVVEIGAGAGTLTREIAAKAKRVVSYEIDGSLRPVLAETLKGADNVEVVFRDFLKEKTPDFEEFICEDYIVIANLPYYITTPVIMKFVEEAKRCKRLVIMVQEEVALRLAAKENTPDYGGITASIAVTGDAKIVKKVPRNMFYPVPNVDSAVVRIDLCPPKYGVTDLEFYRKTVKAAFANRRKTLANNLMLSFALTREQAEKVLSLSEIDLLARGETLSPEKFAVLSENLNRTLKENNRI
ncbi:MAG: 16S rRNA (adenine(1518)-N(6)/adenine(1519)-N(6))-dimethyltransferase RsmA [Christensenellaceae bacterium]|nr:16S rRNA (adenine(1518)-N(6)/adenine(1519)-N(6))-dimethyltransferase RsmA [Christensenellaceae bacterium]MDY2851583.1 16S rRNA (adenine(1518)-N(6)/adenine(1519)-N(6))-dimethyltransferase RsmA [Christensenellaceae bacterium]